MRLKLLSSLLICASLGGCATYLHDPSLVAPTTAADDALTNAGSLAPFDDQLGKLAKFAEEEDQAVAAYWTATRDADLAELLARGNVGPRTLKAARDRLAVLATTAASSPTSLSDLAKLAGRRERALVQEREYLRQAVVFAESWVSVRHDDDTRPTDCKSVVTFVTPDQADEMALSTDDAVASLGGLAAACYAASDRRGEVVDADKRFATAGGEISRTAAAVTAAERDAQADASPYAAALAAEVKQAGDNAKNGTAKQLTDFISHVETILTGAGQAARLAGWKSVSEGVDKFIRAQVCHAPKGTIDDAKLEAADCKGVTPRSTTGRVMATVAFAEALAQLMDANAPQARSAQWLLAAKAIIEAERADAALQTEAAGKRAATGRRQLEAMLREAAALRQATLAGSPQAECVGQVAACAFASYAGSWNEGRIPYVVLAFRLAQIDREYAVRRARAVAVRQRALALAGTSSLKAYSAGGIPPATIAQLILDLSLIGVTGAK